MLDVQRVFFDRPKKMGVPWGTQFSPGSSQIYDFPGVDL